MMAMDDWELLRSHRAGDKSALETLIRRHVDFVYATARRQAGAAQAEDITQAVFLLLTRKARSLRRRGSVVGWLYRATRYCASNAWRVEARRRQNLQEAAMQRGSAAPKWREPPWAADLDAALERIGDLDRQAVILHCAEGRTFEESGQLLGISAEAARKRTDRALARLRDFLLAQGYAAPASSVIGAVLAGGAARTPALLAQAVMAAASRGTVSLAVSTVAQYAGKTMTAVKLKTAAGIACMTGTVAAGIVAVVVLLSRLPITPQMPSVPALSDRAQHVQDMLTGDTPTPDLSPAAVVQLTAEPTEAEARAALKRRLPLLARLAATYTVHTEYPADGQPPATGGAPAIVPTGSSDATKRLFLRDGEARYERVLQRVQRTAALPAEAREFYTQIYVFARSGPQRLFLDRDGNPLLASLEPPERRPEPDLETALLLCNQPDRQGDSLTWYSPDMFDAMAIQFVDGTHAVLAALIPHGIETWTLDRSLGYAPTSYRRFLASDTPDVELAMSDFAPVNCQAEPDAAGWGSLQLPRSIVRISRIGPAAAPWRIERMTVSACQLGGAENTPQRYAIDWPGGKAPAAHAPDGAAAPAELRVGNESLDFASLAAHLAGRSTSGKGS